MRSIFITSTVDSGNSYPSLSVCHLSDCLSLSNDAWFVFRVCLYLPASASLFYLCQFRRRDRGIMLSASRRDATRHPRQLLSNAGPVFQLTLFSWQHQTVYVLSAKVMSKQTPLDGKCNKENYNFAKNWWKVKAAKAPVPTLLNSSLSNVWKLQQTHTDFFCQTVDMASTFLVQKVWIYIVPTLFRPGFSVLTDRAGYCGTKVFCLEIQHACKIERRSKHKWTEAWNEITSVEPTHECSSDGIMPKRSFNSAFNKRKGHFSFLLMGQWVDLYPNSIHFSISSSLGYQDYWLVLVIATSTLTGQKDPIIYDQAGVNQETDFTHTKSSCPGIIADADGTKCFLVLDLC